MNLAQFGAIARRGSILVIGIAEQGLSSLTMFVFVLVLAREVSAQEFGQFSVAWSFVMLTESLLWGLFGDAVPAIANRLPKGIWPQLRSSLYIWSIAISGTVAVIGVILGLIAAASGSHTGGIVAVSSIAALTMRLQQLFRRLCFLDGLRGLAVIGMLIYSLALFGSLYIMRQGGVAGPELGMASLAIACLVSAMTVIFRLSDFRKPSRRVALLVLRRCWLSGKWLVASSLSFWLGNFGLIPLAGLLYGIASSGSLRILQNLMNPLTQLNTAIFTVILPIAARRLRKAETSEIYIITRLSIGIFGAFSIIYGIAITTTGVYVLHALFEDKAKGVTYILIAIMAIAGIADSIRQGAAVSLFALNQTRAFFFSRTASILVLFAVLPATAYFGDLSAIVIAMAISNVSATIALIYFLVRLIQLRRDGLKAI